MYPNGGGYQPQFLAGPQQAQMYNGPPPAKKSKGNPIITRYPPPPGYKGPAQPNIPQQQPGWQQHTQPYGFGQPGYPPQAYAAPPSYQQMHFQPSQQAFPQPQWPAYQGQPFPPPAYPPSQSYPQPLGQSYMSPAQSFPAPPPAWQASNAAPHIAVPPQWQAPGRNASKGNQHQHSSAFLQHGKKSSLALLDGNGDPYPASVVSEDLEDDFDCECYFARHPDEVNPAFSLGQIEWRAPVSTKLALPATFQEAELEALAPRKPPPDDETSISEYFFRARREEAFLSVRQTDHWEDVKDDLIYREFPVVCQEILSMSELLDNYRDRPDQSWSKPRPLSTASTTPDLSRQATPANGEVSSDAMDTNWHQSSDRPYQKTTSENGQMLDPLEQALFPDGNTKEQADAVPGANGISHSRSVSASSQAAEGVSRPKPIIPVRDQAQEDILAALGVTGSPKLVYETPGPAFGAPPSQSANDTVAAKIRHHSASGVLPPPPPPPVPRSPSYDPWKTDDQQRGNDDRPGSSHSHHTAPGSDFGGDCNEKTPRPQNARKDTRKRGYDAFDRDDRQHEDNDPTPKQRRTLPKDTDPYTSRRW